MKVQCDLCEHGEASVMCCADEAVLCGECDQRIHTANKLASKHQRVSLVHPTSEEPTCCDICQDKVGYFFCLEDRALLCRSCDFSIHSTNALTAKHKRFLVTGIRVALEASQIASESAEGTTAVELSETHSYTKMKASEVSSTKAASLPEVASSGFTDSEESGRMAPNLIFHEQAEKWGIIDALSLESIKLHQALQVAASGEEAMVVSPSNLASVPVNPFDQVHVNSNWELHPGILGEHANDRAVASQTGADGFVTKSSISEYLTHTIPGWRVDDLLSFTYTSSNRNFAGIQSLKKDVWSYGDPEWQGDSNTFEEFMLAQGPAEVPSLPSPPPSSGVVRLKRGWGLGNFMRPSDLDGFLQYDDALVVSDGRTLIPPAIHLPTSLPPKRQRIGADF